MTCWHWTKIKLLNINVCAKHKIYTNTEIDLQIRLQVNICFTSLLLPIDDNQSIAR